MCVEADEIWLQLDRWPAMAECVDCGALARGVTEDLGPDDEDGYEREDAAAELLLNDGVTDWSLDLVDGWDYTAAVGEVAQLLPSIVLDTQHVCDCCAEARRWLDEWCHSYMFGRYRDDIVEHWDENEVTRSPAMARLVVAARRRWVIGGRRLAASEVARLVDRSLEVLRAELRRVGAA